MRWVPSSHAFRAPLTAALLVAAGLAVNACALTQNESEVDTVAGKQLFVEKCGSCHVLNRAGTKGTTGPNLDQAFQQGLKDGMGRSGVRGTVRSQINSPRIGSQMPADLVKGAQADQVAAYVAQVVARRGEDTGLLATAVKKAGGGKPAVAKGGTLEVDADANGQLAYVTNQAQATPGQLTVESKNASTTPHNIVIDGKGTGQVVQGGGVSSFKADFTAGTYTFYCSVDGHRAAGMQGKLVVK
jgi:plastocyanin